MKNGLFALLVIVFMFSFVGCDTNKVEDKSEEVVQNYVGFMEANSKGGNLMNGVEWGSENVNLSMLEYDTSGSYNVLTSIVRNVILRGVYSYDDSSVKVTKKSGMIEVEVDNGETYGKEYVNAKDVEIEIKYTTSGGEEKVANVKFSIEFEREERELSKEPKEGLLSGDIKSFVLDGKTYKPVSYSIKMSGKGYTFISAKYDGNDVNLDLLNSTFSSIM